MIAAATLSLWTRLARRKHLFLVHQVRRNLVSHQSKVAACRLLLQLEQAVAPGQQARAPWQGVLVMVERVEGDVGPFSVDRQHACAKTHVSVLVVAGMRTSIDKQCVLVGVELEDLRMQSVLNDVRASLVFLSLNRHVQARCAAVLVESMLLEEVQIAIDAVVVGVQPAWRVH